MVRIRDDLEELSAFIATSIRQQVAKAKGATEYRRPLVGFVEAADPRFRELRRLASPAHLAPEAMLPGARGVVSFYLPFARWVVEANEQHSERVAHQWAVAYVETNALIGHITARLIRELARQGIRATAEPATHKVEDVRLSSRWSHKSVAVLAGLGSFGLHQMVITDAGCTGRFGSLVVDARLPTAPAGVRERCLFFHDESCVTCVARCPVHAIDITNPLDKEGCHQHLHSVARRYKMDLAADVCGKCAIGPCSFESAVP
jgi:epoxyqueuosine reductase QueG